MLEYVQTVGRDHVSFLTEEAFPKRAKRRPLKVLSHRSCSKEICIVEVRESTRDQLWWEVQKCYRHGGQSQCVASTASGGSGNDM